MENLIYLLIVIAVSAVGISVLALRNRRPNSLESGIEEFNARMRALAPPPDEDGGDNPRSGGE